MNTLTAMVALALTCVGTHAQFGLPHLPTLTGNQTANYKSGVNGVCDMPETSLKFEVCVGGRQFRDTLLDTRSKSVMLPGASFGQQGPVNLLVKYPDYGSSGPKLSFVRVQYQFALGVGDARIVSGGVGQSHVTVQLNSPRTSGYAYRILYYTA